MDDYLKLLPEIIIEAGDHLMTYFNRPHSYLNPKKKKDGTWVTNADVASNEFLQGLLNQAFPTIPILSEESEESHAPSIRHAWSECWCLDPLDSTSGFLAGSDEFSINLALIRGAASVLGVLYFPAKSIGLIAQKGKGAYFFSKENRSLSPIGKNDRKCDALHFVLGFGAFNKKFIDAIEGRGWRVSRYHGSYKFYALACGLADIYIRRGRFSEWDAAAADCILAESGGCLLDFMGRPLQYNASPSLEVSSILAMAIDDQAVRDQLYNLLGEK